MNYLITDGVFDIPQSVERGPEQQVRQELWQVRIDKVNCDIPQKRVAVKVPD